MGFEVLVTLDGRTFRGIAQNKKAAKAAAARDALMANPHLLKVLVTLFDVNYKLYMKDFSWFPI